MQVLQDCYRFLGVDDTFVPNISVRPNIAPELGQRRPPLLPETRECLTATHRKDIQALQRLLDRDLTHWLTAKPEPPIS